MTTIIPFGSCRIKYFFKNKNIFTEFTHTSKQILHLIKLVKMNENELQREYSDDYLLINRFINNRKRFMDVVNSLKIALNHKQKNEKNKVIVIEISSLKQIFYKPKQFYIFSDLCPYVSNKTKLGPCDNKKTLRKIYYKSDYIKENSVFNTQTKEELLLDLNDIYTYIIGLKNTRLVLVPHINCYVNKKKIKNRDIICEALNQFTKNREKCHYFNPIDFLKNKNAEDIFEKNSDGVNIGHYNNESWNKIKESIHKFIEEILDN